MLRICFVGIVIVLTAELYGQDVSQEQVNNSITINEFDPQPKLNVETTPLVAAKFPVIDVHTHFRFKTKGSRETIEAYVRDVMDAQNIRLSVSLDATLGAEDEHFQLLGGELADRFGVMVHIDFQGGAKDDDFANWACNQPNFVRMVVERLRFAKEHGCIGVKFFKQFGLGFRDSNGNLIQIDDPRFDPIWEACGELSLPVLIHSADPVAFFDPIDHKNERAEELTRHPDWSFSGADFPTHDDLLAARNRVIERHPKTMFIGAHVANYPEDLDEVSKWLNQYPNFYVDISSRISELGRQPRRAKVFFEEHADRILFGTDGPWPAERLTYYWRFLETNDEYFRYSEKHPLPQGQWFIYGIELEDSILRKVYFENALKLFPALNAKFEKSK
ncbi:MAG: amidohydrolase family protein [Pirellulaceae bacterium]